MNLNLLNLREMDYKDHNKIFQVDSAVIWGYKCKPWPYSSFGNLVGFQKTRASFCSSKYK